MAVIETMKLLAHLKHNHLKLNPSIIGFPALILLIVLLLSTTPAQASLLQDGSWTDPGGAPIGIWTEYFWGGGPGQPGNEIQAYKPLTPAYWSLIGALLTSAVQDPVNQNVWNTTYTGGTLSLSNMGPWWQGSSGGYDYVEVAMTSFTNTTTLYQDGHMAFSITGYGLYNDQNVWITATYGPGAPATGTLPSTWNPVTGITADWNYQTGILTSSTISVNTVPIPGALWLLGTGLLGLAGLRRSKRK
jgi:hypothetical protein